MSLSYDASLGTGTCVMASARGISRGEQRSKKEAHRRITLQRRTLYTKLEQRILAMAQVPVLTGMYNTLQAFVFHCQHFFYLRIQPSGSLFVPYNAAIAVVAARKNTGESFGVNYLSW